MGVFSGLSQRFLSLFGYVSRSPQRFKKAFPFPRLLAVRKNIATRHCFFLEVFFVKIRFFVNESVSLLEMNLCGFLFIAFLLLGIPVVTVAV